MPALALHSGHTKSRCLGAWPWIRMPAKHDDFGSLCDFIPTGIRLKFSDEMNTMLMSLTPQSASQSMSVANSIASMACCVDAGRCRNGFVSQVMRRNMLQ